MSLRNAQTVLAIMMLAGWGQVSQASAPEADVRLEPVEPLPFASDELTQAVRARLRIAADKETGTVVQTAGNDDGSVLVSASGTHRAVPLQGETGKSAARLVAIAIADMLLAQARPDPAPKAAAPTLPIPQISKPKASQGPPPSRRFKLPPLRFDLRLGAVGGVAGDEPAGIQLGLGVAMSWGVLLCRMEGAWWHIFRQRVQFGGAPNVTFNAALARIEAGLRFSFFELRAGPFVAPYQVSQDNENDGGVLGGMGMGLRAHMALTPRWGVFMGSGLDAYFNRIRVVSIGSTALATPTLGWWVGAGMSWDLKS